MIAIGGVVTAATTAGHYTGIDAKSGRSLLSHHWVRSTRTGVPTSRKQSFRSGKVDGLIDWQTVTYCLREREREKTSNTLPAILPHITFTEFTNTTIRVAIAGDFSRVFPSAPNLKCTRASEASPGVPERAARMAIELMVSLRLDAFRSPGIALEAVEASRSLQIRIGAGDAMAFVRAIGRWALTGLMINCTIGGGIFGVPGVLAHRLGVASPIAMMAGGITVAIIIACAVEVASQFPEPGGSYVYVRRAFGQFAGLQAAWFYWLAALGGVAAIATVFASYLEGIVPVLALGWVRPITIALLLAIPTIINCLGVRSGARLSSVFAIAKLLPLGLLIVLGLERSVGHAVVIRSSDLTTPGWGAWFPALLAVFFVYDGWENVVVPSGEVKEPRRTIPFALAAGLLATIVVYTLLQYLTITTIGTSTTDHPLADIGTLLMGDAGRTLVSAGAIVSTYGYIAAAFVTAPRLPYALAIAGEAPPVLAILHRRSGAPVYAIAGFAILSWALAVSGTFRWALELSAGSAAIICAGVCASLLRLRRMNPTADALRLPFGPALAALGIALCAVLLAQLDARHVILLLVTASLPVANWLWAARQTRRGKWRAGKVEAG
jgi:basic amino acid/polyamine antiporter, APA family